MCIFWNKILLFQFCMRGHRMMLSKLNMKEFSHSFFFLPAVCQTKQQCALSGNVCNSILRFSFLE